MRLAVGLRTGALALLLAVLVLTTPTEALGVGAGALLLFVALGVGALLVIGLRGDQAGRWSQPTAFALYAVDVAAISALFALAPLSHGGDVPQIIAFRAYGVYYYTVPIALAALALSPTLVLWAATLSAVCWLAAWGSVVAGMPETLSWPDVQFGADRERYLSVFLDPRFVGRGSRISEALFLIVSGAILAVAVWRARRVFLSHVALEADRRFLADAFGSYVPAPVAEELLRTRGDLAPRTVEATILVLDVAGFTAWAETRSPATVIETLNAFLADAAEVVAAEGGVAVSFVGDGLVAAFNAPRPLADHRRAALRAALALENAAAATRFDGARLPVRIGVATGPVAAGSVGAARRRAFTVYGDVVNRAQRLEAMCKTLDRTILADRAAAQAVDPAIALTALGAHSAPGVAAPIEAFGVAAASAPRDGGA